MCTKGRITKGSDNFVEVQGMWEPLYRLWGETTLSVSHGTERTNSQTTTKEWSSAVSASAEAGISVLGLELSVETSKSLAEELTEELTESSESSEERVFTPTDGSAFLWQFVYDITTTASDGTQEHAKTRTKGFALTAYKGSVPKCLPGYCAGVNNSCETCQEGGWLNRSSLSDGSGSDGISVMNCERGLCPDEEKFQLDLHWDYVDFAGTLSDCREKCLKRPDCTGIEWRNESDSESHCKFYFQNACTRRRVNETSHIDNSYKDSWTCDKVSYAFGKLSTQKCPNGFAPLGSADECKVAADAVNRTFGKEWKHGQRKRPKGCYQDSPTRALLFNDDEEGSAHPGSRLLCKQEDISVRSVTGRWSRIDNKNVWAHGEYDMLTIYLDTYLGKKTKNQNTMVMSQAWADAAKASASANLFLGESKQLGSKASRAVAEKFKDDWSTNEFTKTRVPYEIEVTPELVENLENNKTKQGTFWQWVFDVKTYGADTITLYTGSFVRTLGAYENPDCIPGYRLKEGRCASAGDDGETLEPYPREIHDLSISGYWAPRGPATNNNNLMVGTENGPWSALSPGEKEEWAKILRNTYDAGMRTGGGMVIRRQRSNKKAYYPGTKTQTAWHRMRESFMRDFANERTTHEWKNKTKTKTFPKGFLWQWEYKTNIYGEAVKTRTPSYAVTDGEWQKPACLPKHAKNGNVSYQQCRTNGTLPGLQAQYAEFGNAKCEGQPTIARLQLGSLLKRLQKDAAREMQKAGNATNAYKRKQQKTHELEASGKGASLATCTKERSKSHCSYVKVKCLGKEGAGVAEISWWRNFDCSTPCASPVTFTLDNYLKFRQGRCAATVAGSSSYMANAMHESLPQC